jgi:hypothetical protein
MSSTRTHPPGDGPAHPDASCPLGSGDVLAGRYAVEVLVGEGTFGWVFAALDVAASPPCRVALKVLRPRYAAQGEVLRRFERRELALLQRVEAASPTPHVVRAHASAVLWHGPLPYLVLEFIDGPSLREVLDAGALESARACALGAGLARGLAAIHAVGGVHRDLKPTNVRMRGGREPVIVDLGITRALWETQEATEPGPSAMTPRYASPEQLAGREVGPASDVYSLGLILCELLTGALPLSGEDVGKLLAARSERLPVALREWVPRCLEREPERRPSARELASVLEGASVPVVPPRRSRALRWAAGACAVLLLALGGVAASRPRWLAPVLRAASGAPASGAPQRAGPPWSLRWGDSERQALIRMVLDASGHLLVVAQLRGIVDVGTGPLTSAGSNDVLVARLDAKGGTLWSRRFGDGDVQNVNHLASGPEGDVFLVGSFIGTLDFGGEPLFNTGDEDIFLARLDAGGRTLWSRQFGDMSAQGAHLVAVDADGDALISGRFHGEVDFGEGPLVSAGLSDVFLARFTPEGELRWSRRFGAAQQEDATGLAVDAEGHIALSGTFEGSIDLGGGALTSPRGRGHFIALFDNEGQLRWSRLLGDAEVPRGGPVAFDATGHLFVVERGEGGGSRAFAVTRFTREGHPLWSRRFEGRGPQDVLGLAAAPGGGVVVAGVLGGELDFGDGVSSGLGETDAFVLELGAEGDLLRVRRFGDAAHQFGQSVAVDAAGSVLVAGTFEGTVDFGNGPLVSAGQLDFFLARLAPPLAPPPLAGKGAPCVAAPPGRVAGYPFEGSEPGAAVGTAPPGRLHGSASPSKDGQGGALRLEGGFFEVPDAEAFDVGQGPFTLSLWMRTSQAGGTQALLDKRREPPNAGPVAGYHLYVQRGWLGFQLGDGVGPGTCQMVKSVSCTNYRSGRFVADGAWHLVTVTVERGSPFGGTFYVDGVAATRFDPTVRTGSLDNDSPLRLGSRSSSASGAFLGLVDEVALWKRALTPDEVASLHRAGRAGLCRAQSSEPPRRP